MWGVGFYFSLVQVYYLKFGTDELGVAPAVIGIIFV